MTVVPPQPDSRRDFASRLVLVILAIFSGGLFALREWFRFRRPAPQWIARADEIPVGGSKLFAFPRQDEPCILIRPAAESYLAFSRLCTHNSCAVFYNFARAEFDCPCHNGVFSALDGAVLAGPPPRPLPHIRIERRGNDLFATGVSQG